MRKLMRLGAMAIGLALPLMTARREYGIYKRGRKSVSLDTVLGYSMWR